MGLNVSAQQVLDAIPDSSAILDAAGTIVATNQTWRGFSTDNGGSPEHTDIGINYLAVCRQAADSGSEDARAVMMDLLDVLQSQAVERQYEYECGSPDFERWFRTRVTLVSQAPLRVMVSHLNITREKRAEQNHRQEAETDLLTGLLNRRGLGRRIKERLQGANERVACHGVIYLDLDGFKGVNDRMGHLAGDELLQVVAARLRKSVKSDDLVARLGGDEFAILAEVSEPADLERLSARVTKVIAEPIMLNGHLVTVGVSSGWQLLGEHDDVRDALHNADINMLANKRRKQISLPPGHVVLPQARRATEHWPANRR